MAHKLVIELPDGSWQLLEQVPAEHELQLQEQLKRQPELLPLEELGLVGPAMVVGRESSLDSGRVDLVLLGNGGDLALVEFKTGPQNPDFRECLAQLLARPECAAAGPPAPATPGPIAIRGPPSFCGLTAGSITSSPPIRDPAAPVTRCIPPCWAPIPSMTPTPQTTTLFSPTSAIGSVTRLAPLSVQRIVTWRDR
jgi:hypothetical protein